MNRKFQSAIHHRDDVTYVKLGGVIDEDNELGELMERMAGSTVVIDLAEIERINSCGVRDWVNWLGKVEKTGTRVVLVECSPAIVAQINLVNNFTGSGVVKSFFAPYFCPNCDREKVLLVETSELGPPPHKAPTCRCDECDGVMDFDDMEDSYFAFLSSAKRVAEAAKINAVVSEFSLGASSRSGNDEKSKLRSRVGSSANMSPVQLGMNASSLPSVPALPPLGRQTSSSFGAHSAQSAVSVAGHGMMMGGRFGSAGSNPGAAFGPPGPGMDGRALSLGQRQMVPATVPRSGKLVYLLVVVLIAAICVLAVLLFSGGARR
jgi:anti-anti-sigma regulatory factor